MKTKLLYRVAIVIAMSAAVVACKKNNSDANSGQSSADLQTQSDDQTQVNNETDAVANDVNTVLSDQSTVTGSSTPPGYSQGIAVQGGKADTIKSYICDATIVRDTVSNPHTLTVTYNGSNCAGTRTRTGTVIVSWAAGSHWRDKGATVTVQIKSLKITRVRDGKSVTINGTHLYTNVSGGSLADLPKAGSITHTITSDDMSITFDNGSARSWHVARQRVYTYSDNTGITITTSGLHTDGSTSGISEWGTNRFGNSFEIAIAPNNPIVISSSCNFRITSGSVSTIRPAVTTTLTFGLDKDGNPTGCPGDGYYYFKLVWEGSGGKTYTFILPY